jgi:fluoride exporter
MMFVAIGGFFGAISRYLLGMLMMKWIPKPPIPAAILLVNWFGSFGLGFFTTHLSKISENLVLLVSVGFFGSFTTFSAFSLEAYDLIRRQEWEKAIIYIFLTIVGSLFAYWLGFSL